MAKGGNTVGAVRAIVEPIAQSLGLSVWDIRFLKEGATWYLRIFIDNDLTHAINDPLDEADPIEQAYCLEVSSPGVERELTRDAHFAACLGAKIKVRTIRPVEGQRDFSGVLEGYEDGQIALRSADGAGLSFGKKEVSWVKLDDFQGFGD